MTKNDFKTYLRTTPIQKDGKKIAEYIKRVLIKADVVTSASEDLNDVEKAREVFEV